MAILYNKQAGLNVSKNKWTQVGSPQRWFLIWSSLLYKWSLKNYDPDVSRQFDGIWMAGILVPKSECPRWTNLVKVTLCGRVNSTKSPFSGFVNRPVDSESETGIILFSHPDYCGLYSEFPNLIFQWIIEGRTLTVTVRFFTFCHHVIWRKNNPMSYEYFDHMPVDFQTFVVWFWIIANTIYQNPTLATLLNLPMRGPSTNLDPKLEHNA